jgi:2-iminobutanoate/2-iminopropanoate deaminase
MSLDPVDSVPGRPLGGRKVADYVPGPTGPYSPAIAAGGFVFVSGQRPVDPLSNVIPAGIGEQTLQVGKNLCVVLASAGVRLRDVVKVTAHLSDLRLFDDFNAVYSQVFEAPYPARTTVGSQLRGVLVEMDVIAVQRSEVS